MLQTYGVTIAHRVVSSLHPLALLFSHDGAVLPAGIGSVLDDGFVM